MKPTLLIMAAGMGSRYGGLKQIEAVGPDGATLLDFSIYDALKAGFGKIVFIIRRDIEEDFKRIVGKKWESKVPVHYVFQELSLVPEGFQAPGARKKPWGTGHAVWVARDAVKEPFAAINADDFYGSRAFKILAGYLSKLKRLEEPAYSMVAYKLKNTLSPHGTVSRGVCRVSPNSHLKNVVERLKIGKKGSILLDTDENGKTFRLTGAEPVSMNFWGFTPALFDSLGRHFKAFLEKRGQEEKSEFILPVVIDELIRKKEAKVKVLTTNDKWIGITYPEDKEKAKEAIQSLLKKKKYPPALW